MTSLQGLQFRFQHDDPYMGYPDPEHSVTAYEGGSSDPENYRGQISWHQQTGEIGYIRTGNPSAPEQEQQQYRHQGIGTALLRQAQFESASRGLAQPRHSSDLTEAGEGFAQARPL